MATSLSDYISKNQMCTLGQVRNSITDFNDLQNSKEILHNILLCNPHLSSEQFSHVLQMYDVEFSKLDDQKLERIIQDTYFISNSRGTFHTLSSIKDCLSTKNSTAEDICSNTCAELLCQKLGDTLGRKRGVLIELSHIHVHTNLYLWYCQLKSLVITNFCFFRNLLFLMLKYLNNILAHEN